MLPAMAAPPLTTTSIVAASATSRLDLPDMLTHSAGRRTELAERSSASAVHSRAGGLTLLTSSLGLLTTASKSKDGSYAYNSATVPFLAESLKLAVSGYLLQRQVSVDADRCSHWLDVS